MASLENYRNLVKQILTEYGQISPSDSGVENTTIFDLENDRYILLSLGWSKGRRIHYCVMHIDIIDTQVWIQANNTDRLIAEELVAAGIPQKLLFWDFNHLKFDPTRLMEYLILNSNKKH